MLLLRLTMIQTEPVMTRIFRWGPRAAQVGRAMARRPGGFRAFLGPRAFRRQDADEAEARIAATIRYWRAWLGWPEVERVVIRPSGEQIEIAAGDQQAVVRFAPTAATARTAVVSAATLLITLGSIQSQQVLSNRTGCLLGFRPNSRLIARHPLLLVHVRLDQARIDRKTLTANQPGRHAPSPPRPQTPGARHRSHGNARAALGRTPNDRGSGPRC